MADFGAVERDRRGVDNSWMLMRAPGELLPFIVDVSAARIEPGALQRAVARGRK